MLAMTADFSRVCTHPDQPKTTVVPCYTRSVFLQGHASVSDPEGLMKYRVPAGFAVCAFCALFLVFLTTPAYAYGDPNAVGLASQIITPLLIMLSAGIAFLRKQIGAAFVAVSRRLRRRDA
jgi:hypothetical protein